ncbi:helix-turn-helix transcriptional regulator [Actinoplanes italicus]|nr:DNA-binding protein [Actinoplanes italicus]
MTPRRRLVRLMGTGEIRARLGYSRQWTQRIIDRDDFPAPGYVLGGRRVWLASEVEGWIRKHRPDLAKEPGEEGE